MRKRLFSGFLALVMLLGLLPTTAFAAIFEAPVGIYNFYSASGQPIAGAQQIVKVGEQVDLTLLPAEEKDHEVFLGWTIAGSDGTSETTAPDDHYTQPVITGDVTYTVTPRFRHVHYVMFMDHLVENRVYDTLEIGDDFRVDPAEVTNYQPPSGKKLVGWSYNKNSDTVDFRATDVLNRHTDYMVYPVLVDATTVTFHYQDEFGATLTVSSNDNGTVTAPADPQRVGYDFGGWTYWDGTSYQDFDFTSTDLKSDLYARWNPELVDYTVVFWQENADDTNYSYAGQEVRRASAGQTVTAASSDAGKFTNFTLDTTTMGSAVVKGDGSTVLDVYYSRDRFTLTFRSGSRTVHTITAKHGSYIADQFSVPGYEGRAWDDTGRTFSYALQTLDRMPATNVTFGLYNQSSQTLKQIYYWGEIVEGEDLSGVTTTTNAGVTYKLLKQVPTYFNYATYEEEYHEIAGYDRMSRSAAGFGSYNNRKDFTNRRLDLYYLRSSYVLTYQSQGDVVDRRQIDYGASLAGAYTYVPPKPSGKEDYTFGGWYLSPLCEDGAEANVHMTTMPFADAIVYAKWNPPTHNIQAYYILNGYKAEIPVFHGQTVTADVLPTVSEMVTKLNEGLTSTAPNWKSDSDFLGWFTQSGAPYWGGTVTGDTG